CAFVCKGSIRHKDDPVVHHPVADLDPPSYILFFFSDPAPTEIYTLSLHDALPIWRGSPCWWIRHSRRRSTSGRSSTAPTSSGERSEEHTSELQSPCNLVCRLLLEKKKSVMAGTGLTIT